MKNPGEDFKVLVEQVLEAPMPQRCLGDLPSETLSPEAMEMIRRALALMKRAGYSVAHFNPYLIRWLCFTVPGLLPKAWGGRVPPFTLPGRHRKLDDYVMNQARPSESRRPPVFVDIGCGFPPVTTADTAGLFPDWRVVGVDRSFAEYVLYDRDGPYACFDGQGRFQYFQGLMKESARWPMQPDPEVARKHFVGLYERLFPLLPKNDEGPGSVSVEQDGHRLVHRHIRDFETERLSFIERDIRDLDLPGARVVRCMNVLLYFPFETRKEMLVRAAGLLEDQGLLIAGTNGLAIQTRYAVYRKQQGTLSLTEFAFSPDNLGHVVMMPWLSFHENDPEAMLLAELAGVIRTHPSLGPEFSLRLDELMDENSLCQRDASGMLRFPDELQPLSELLPKSIRLWQQVEQEGYPDRMVEALTQAGYESWKNSVGDIAVRPKAFF